MNHVPCHSRFVPIKLFSEFQKRVLQLLTDIRTRVSNLERDAVRSMGHGEASDVLQPVSSVDDLKA